MLSAEPFTRGEPGSVYDISSDTWFNLRHTALANNSKPMHFGTADAIGTSLLSEKTWVTLVAGTWVAATD